MGDVVCDEESVFIGSSDNMDSWLLCNTLPLPIDTPFTGESDVLRIIFLVCGLATIMLAAVREFRRKEDLESL